MADGSARQRHLILRYPIVTLTVIVGVLGAGVWLAGFSIVAQWGFGLFALMIAGIEAVRMVGELRRRHFGVDILAIIAIVATVAVGEVIASMIIVLMVSGGKALEDFAQGRAQRELTALLDREPQTAHRLNVDSGKAVDIPASDVVVGDLILILSGEAVPVDGILKTATAAFDESSLTGESLPCTRLQGEQVLSGSVNGNTSVTILATARAQDSQYQAIVGLVSTSGES